MAASGREQDGHRMEAEKALAGILALLVEDRERRVGGDKEATKIEVLLASAGLSYEDIAAVTAKNEGAIRKAIQRAKAK